MSDSTPTLERVADAIGDALYKRCGTSLSDDGKRLLARAALDASGNDERLPRIPTAAMVAAAWSVIGEQKSASGIAKLGPGLGVREIWQAMYDAAIARTQEQSDG